MHIPIFTLTPDCGVVSFCNEPSGHVVYLASMSNDSMTNEIESIHYLGGRGFLRCAEACMKMSAYCQYSNGPGER